MKTNLADKWFSKFIRIRDAVNSEYGQCCTCGKYASIKSMDCGHYVKRQFQSARYNEKNCAMQCKSCNNFEQGNDTKFRAHLVEKYGENAIMLIESGKRQTVRRNHNDLKQLADYYKKKAIELAKQKDIKIW